MKPATRTRVHVSRTELLQWLLVLGPPTLVALVGVLWYVPHARDEAIAQWREEVLDHVSVVSESVDRLIEDGVGDAATIASFPSVQAFLAGSSRGLPHGEGSVERPAATLDRLRGLEGFSRIFLIGPAGEPLLASPASAELEPGCRADLRSALATGIPYSGLHHDAWGGTVLLFAAPEVGATGESLQGWVLAETDIRKCLTPLLQRTSWAAHSEEILLSRILPDSVEYFSPSHDSSSPPLTLHQPLRDARGRVNAAAAPEGVGETIDDRGVTVFTAAYGLFRSPWRIVVKVDRDEVLREPVRFAWIAVLAWTAVAAVLSIAAGSHVARPRRLRALAFAARQGRLTRLLEETYDAILVGDLAGRVLRVNLRAAELYGEPAEQLVGKDMMLDLCAGAEHPACRAQLQTVIERGWALFETLHRRGDGEEFPVEVSSRLVSEGHEQYIVSVVRDITARRQAEKGLRATTDALRAMVESSPIPIVTLTRDGLVVFWSPAATRLFGWEAGEVVGGPCPAVPEEDRGELRKLIERAWGGEMLINVPQRRRHRDGRNLHVLLTAAPLREGGTGVTGILTLQVDVTEHDRLRRLSREIQEKLDAFYRTSALGMFFGDIHGAIDSANDEFLRIIGYSRADLEQKRIPWADITPPEYLPLDAKGLAEARLRGVCDPYEKEYLRKGGTRIWVQVGFALLGEERERSVAYIVDISRRKLAEDEIRRLNLELERRVEERTAELAAANHELEAFSYSVSHDLRAPLRAIAGFSRILTEDHRDALNEEGRRVLRVVSESALSMGHLIDELLTFSRAGRHEIERHPVDMRMLARSVFQEMCPPGEEASVDLRLDEIPDAWADSGLIRQVWVNLIGNALKFSAPRARRIIEIGAREEEAGTIYTVRDNGVGFDMRHADKMFSVFQRLHPLEKFEGTGVGLAIVQRIVQRHGGRVWAEGVPDAGATFSFLLPRAPKAP